MDSDIQNFYKNKTIFITGGSGFLGRVIIEKLLRATEIRCIYVLIRAKRGKEIQDRISEWKTDPFFGVLLKSRPNALKRVVAMKGDCEEPDLGISSKDREVLVREVELVVHGAATVNFAEPLHVALDINTRATRLMLQLAKQMLRLVAFVHVSTAYCNCVVHHITERFYPELLSCNADKVLLLREQLDNKLIDRMESALVDKFPNTYTFTKALAEQLIQTEAESLPVCIFRPGPIIPTSKEPVAGWINNIYGPIAVMYNEIVGVLRIVHINPKVLSNIVPVDGCANLVLSSGWRTALEVTKCGHRGNPQPPKIYNYVPSESNLLTHKDFMDAVKEKKDICPLEQAIWYPFLHSTTILWLYKLATVFYHIIPGYGMDLALRLQGQKPCMIKIYNKIHKNLDVLKPFMLENWTFKTANTDGLWNSLSKKDQLLFDFDMRSLDWSSYFDRALSGMRIYMAKEDPSEESIERARKRRERSLLFHRLLQLTVACLAAATMRWLLLYLFQ